MWGRVLVCVQYRMLALSASLNFIILFSFFRLYFRHGLFLLTIRIFFLYIICIFDDCFFLALTDFLWEEGLYFFLNMFSFILSAFLCSLVAQGYHILSVYFVCLG